MHQAVFQKDSNNWVLLQQGNKLVQRTVKLGMRGANRSQVLEGLTEGDEIALFPPPAQTL